MKLFLALKEAEREGKTFKRFLLICLMPTPAKGFVLGALVTPVLLIVLRDVWAKVPLIGAGLFGILIVSLAMLWQMISDSYWGGQK
ncbi:MAG TPA: hypothetical protein VMY18_00285 [Acidobacteriota bacterium]|nr:hypothetical protein [Acidobacteriota bacterium]